MANPRMIVSVLLATLIVAGIYLWAPVHWRTHPGYDSALPTNDTSTITASIRRRAQGMTPFARNPVQPLPLCGGDCDSDDECQGDLVCHFRETIEAVPGCEFGPGGNRYVTMDVCVPGTSTSTSASTSTSSSSSSSTSTSTSISKTTAPPVTAVPTVAPVPTAAPTAIGSNSWAQTWGTTDPFTFVGPPATPAPTTERERRNDWSWIFDFTDPQPLEHVGNDGRGPFPLGPCKSDCDSDRDCAGPLECMQRNGGEAVPGCVGEDESDEDYCIWPQGYNATEGYAEMQQQLKPSVPNRWQNGFCLKLYWEEGYNWQNETIERKWCITRNYEGTMGSGMCWHGLDQIDCDPTELYINKCDERDIRQRFRFVPVSSDEVLIQAYRNAQEVDENRCFHRENRKIKLTACNEALHNQRWFAIRGGFNEERFEISQKTLNDHCVNQDHHPKYGEVMRMHSCEKTRGPNHLTSWFNVY